MKRRSHAVTAVRDELPVVMEWSLKLLLVSVMMVKMSSADSLQVGSPDGRTDSQHRVFYFQSADVTLQAFQVLPGFSRT